MRRVAVKVGSKDKDKDSAQKEVVADTKASNEAGAGIQQQDKSVTLVEGVQQHLQQLVQPKEGGNLPVV